MLERVVIHGDLSRLPPEAKAAYYGKVCESVGLNPLTKPFEYLRLNGKEVLYANKGCAEQLRQVHRVSVAVVSRETIEGVHMVTVRAVLPDGRADESTGAVSIVGAKGEALANALMKAETKAKRRATLSICGLGMLDESELETIPRRSFDAPPQSAVPRQRVLALKERIKEQASVTLAGVLAGIATAETMDELQAVTERASLLSLDEREEARRAWRDRVDAIKGEASDG